MRADAGYFAGQLARAVHDKHIPLSQSALGGSPRCGGYWSASSKMRSRSTAARADLTAKPGGECLLLRYVQADPGCPP
jgi:hypothetical protein